MPWKNVRRRRLHCCRCISSMFAGESMQNMSPQELGQRSNLRMENL